MLRAGEDPWARFRFVLGYWESDDPPEAGRGTFSLLPELSDAVLVRRNEADIPAAQGRPPAHHEDLMVVYHVAGHPDEATYYDNEGHTIHYVVSPGVELDRLVLVSDVTTGAPRFRLTYSKAGDDRLLVQFDIAPPGQPDAFAPYVSGHVKRTRPR